MDNKISKKDYWDNIYKDLKDRRFNFSLSSYWNRKFFLLLERYFAKDLNKKMVEIGGAPGTYAILFNKIFQYDSYVIDYSESGIKKTIENFKKNRISQDNAINTDFLNKNKLMAYWHYFDVVFSAGFIEHFKNPSEVLSLHLKILKEGGRLVVMIPVNNFILKFQSFFKKGVVDQYNGSFMNINEFSKILIYDRRIKIEYLNYIGGINLAVVCYNNFFIRNLIYALQMFIQITGLELLIPLNKYTSPYLVCIARKIS